MRGLFSISAALLCLASVGDGARVQRHSATASAEIAARAKAENLVESSTKWGENLVASFTNRAAQARQVAQRATNTHERWVAVSELIYDTNQAALQGEVAMQDLGNTLASIDQQIDDNELRPLLDGQLQVADLQALQNGNALVSISHEFLTISDDLVRISQLSEAIVDTMVAVLDLTESMPELSAVWSGFDTQHLRQLTVRVSAMSEHFAEETRKLQVVEEQLAPLEGWDEMGSWGKARVVSWNFIGLRQGLHGLHDSQQSLNRLYNEEASSTMMDVVSNVRSMQSTADGFGVSGGSRWR